MMEYGRTTGETTQGSGAGGGGGSIDFGGGTDFVTDTIARVTSMPPEQLLLVGVAILVGVVVLKRA
jgi:hypothetical protein